MRAHYPDIATSECLETYLLQDFKASRYLDRDGQEIRELLREELHRNTTYYYNEDVRIIFAIRRESKEHVIIVTCLCPEEPSIKSPRPEAPYVSRLSERNQLKEELGRLQRLQGEYGRDHPARKLHNQRIRDIESRLREMKRDK